MLDDDPQKSRLHVGDLRIQGTRHDLLAVSEAHPRIFTMAEEAVALTVQAGALGAAGEVLVLDKGKPIRIAAAADRLIRQEGPAIETANAGLRAGEKLHEVLFGSGEYDFRPRHNLISHITLPPMDFCTPRDPYDAPMQRSPRSRMGQVAFLGLERAATVDSGR